MDQDGDDDSGEINNEELHNGETSRHPSMDIAQAKIQILPIHLLDDIEPTQEEEDYVY